jgi:hypothetical protein
MGAIVASLGDWKRFGIILRVCRGVNPPGSPILIFHPALDKKLFISGKLWTIGANTRRPNKNQDIYRDFEGDWQRMSLEALWQPQWLGLGILLCSILTTVLFLWSERKHLPGKQPTHLLRQIASFRRMGRVIDDVVESGRQLHLSLGSGGLHGLPGTPVVIGLHLLRWLGGLTSRSDYPPIVTSGNGEVGIFSQDVLDQVDRSRAVDPRDQPIDAQIGGLTPFSYAATTICNIKEKQVTINLIVGHFGSEVGLMTDAGERNDALTLGSSDDLSAQAVLYAAAQESLVGEEIFAANAYLQGSANQHASLRAQDIMHWVVITMILVGIILKLSGLL